MNKILFHKVSIAPLIIFRIIFGALMLFGVLRFISKGWVYDLYIKPSFHFTYLGFDWVKVLPGMWMYLPFVLMFFAALGIILGAYYRIATVLFFLCFTYVELIDKTYYLNHYYFVSLVSFLMIILPANKDFSLDVFWKRIEPLQQVPFWTIFIIKFQLGIVYFFAGVAKINSDWLFDAQPLKIWLQAYRDLPYIGWLFASSFLAYFFSWFGCIYDLSIPFFLSIKKTQKIAYIFVIVFHVVTWMLFPIGVFPWVMIFSTLIFFNEDFHIITLNFLKKISFWKETYSIEKNTPFKKITANFILLYLVFQIVVPFRHYLYPGNLFWNEEGFRFSWRVMLMHKEGHATFYVKDKKTKKELEIQNCDFLTESQIDQMATQPDMILQFSHFLKKKYNDTTFTFGNKSFHLQNPSIHASIFVSLNGRNNKAFVIKDRDLTKYKYDLKHRTWLEKF